MRRLAVVGLFAALTLGLLLLLVVTHERVGSPIARFFLARVETGGGAVLVSEDVRFDGLKGLTLFGTRWSRGDSVLASADTVDVQWPGTRLLGRAIDIDQVRLVGVRVDPAAVARWLADIAPGPAGAGTKRTPPTIRIGRLRFTGVPLNPLPVASQALRVEALAAEVDDLQIEAGRLRVREARLHSEWWIEPAGLPGRFEAVGSWDDGRVEVSTFRITSARSRVAGSARQSFRYADVDGELRLRIERLACADLAPFLPAADSTAAPGFEPDAALTGRVDLTGARAAFWSGPIHLAATGLRPAGVPLDSVSLDLQLTDGFGTIAMSAHAEGRPPGWRDQASIGAAGDWVDSTWSGPVRLAAGAARLEARGTVDLRGGPRIALSAGSFAGIDPARLGVAGAAGRLAGHFDCDWSGGTDDPGGRLHLELEPGTLAGRALEGGTATLRLDGARVAGDVRLRVEGGEYRVDDGAIELGDDIAFDFPRITLRRVDPSRLAPTAGVGAAGDLNARLALKGTLRPRAVPRGPEGWPAALAAGALAGRLRVELDPSTIGGLRLEGGSAELTLERGTLGLDLGVHGPIGALSARAALEDPAGAFAWTVESLSVRRLDLSRLPGARLPPTVLNASVSGRGLGREIGSMAMSGSYALESSLYDGNELRAGAGTLALRDGIAILDGRLDFPWGAVELAASHDRSQQPPRTTFGARVGLTELLSLTQRPLPETDGEIIVTGDGYGADLEQWHGEVDLIGSGRLGAARIPQLRLPIRISGGTATLDSVDFLAPWATFTGAGSVVFADSAGGRRSDLDLHLAVRDPSSLASLAGLDTLAADTLDIRIAARGPARALALDVATVASGVRVNDIRWRTGRLEARVQLTGAGTDLHSGTMHLALEAPRFGAVVAERLRLDVDDDGARSRLDMELALAGGTGLTASGFLDARRAEKSLDLTTLDLVGPRSRWNLEAPASLRFTGARFHVDDLRLRSGDGLVRLSGGVDAAGTQDLSLAIEGFPLAGAAALGGRPDLDGTLDAALDLRGEAGAPTLDARVALDVKRTGQPLLRLEGHAQGSSRHLALDGSLAPATGPPLLLSGSVPFNLALLPDTTRIAPHWKRTDATYDLTLRSDGLDLDFLAAVVDPGLVELDDGELTLRTRILGSATEPRAEGPVRLTARRFQLAGAGLRAEDVVSDWTFGGGQLRLSKLTARAGGTLTAEGEFRITGAAGPSWELRADMESFEVADTRDWRATLTGAGRVGMNGDTLRVAGDFAAKELEYFFTPTTGGVIPTEVSLTEEDYRMLERTFGRDFRKDLPAERWYQLLGLDLNLKLGRNSWYRQRGGPRMAVEASGTLRVAKMPGGDLTLHGRLQTIEGRGFVEQFGRRFEVKSGSIILDGDPLALQLEVSTEYQTPPSRDSGESPVTVTLDVSGTLSEMKLEFSSDPVLTQPEIVSVIATGRPGGVNAGTQGENKDDAAGTAAQMGLSGLTGAVEEMAERNIGLDVVQIRQDGLRGATLVAGKYVTSQFYIGFRQPVSFDAPTSESTEAGSQSLIELEYSAWQWLLLNFQGQGSQLQGFLRGRYAF